MKLFEVNTSSIFNDEIRTYYTLEEDMALALEKVRNALPYEKNSVCNKPKKFSWIEGKVHKMKKKNIFTSNKFYIIMGIAAIIFLAICTEIGLEKSGW